MFTIIVKASVCQNTFIILKLNGGICTTINKLISGTPINVHNFVNDENSFRRTYNIKLISQTEQYLN